MNYLLIAFITVVDIGGRRRRYKPMEASVAPPETEEEDDFRPVSGPMPATTSYR